MKGWIKVEEAHPEDDSTVLLLYDVGDGIVKTGYYSDGSNYYRNDAGAYYGQPVAWMPLPELPDMKLLLK